MVADPLFLAYLAQFDDGAWLRAMDRLQPAMHPVDRTATVAWFHFHPLRLQRALAEATDPAGLAAHLRLQGRWRLHEQQASSHWFLFGHRYWPTVAAEVRDSADVPGSLDLAAHVQALALRIGRRLGVEPSWLVGITAVALRTLQQVGALEDAPGFDPQSVIGGTDARPDRLVSERERRPRGWLARFGGRPRTWTVRIDERPPTRGFPLIDSQHLTTAAALDRRDYRRDDPRCTEGPIPVQCRSCSCGTCWVGVLSGATRLSAVEPRERSTITGLGYSDTPDSHPIIRLACMAQAYGPVTLVVPPWNGQVGSRLEKALVRGVEWPTHDS